MLALYAFYLNASCGIFLSSCTCIVTSHLGTLDVQRVDLKGKVGAELEDGVTMDADASRRWTDRPDVHEQRKMLAKRVSSN